MLDCYGQWCYGHLCTSFYVDKCFHFFWGLRLAVELLVQMVTMFSLGGHTRLLSCAATPPLCPSAGVRLPVSPHPGQYLLLPVFFITAILVGRNRDLIVAFDFFEDVLIGHLYSLKTHIFKFFVHF